MWSSLSKLMQLPPETWVFCAHEYTQVLVTCPTTCRQHAACSANEDAQLTQPTDTAPAHLNSCFPLLTDTAAAMTALPSAPQDNARFAVTVDKENERLQERKKLIDRQRQQVRACS